MMTRFIPPWRPRPPTPIQRDLMDPDQRWYTITALAIWAVLIVAVALACS